MKSTKKDWNDSPFSRMSEHELVTSPALGALAHRFARTTGMLTPRRGLDSRLASGLPGALAYLLFIATGPDVESGSLHFALRLIQSVFAAIGLAAIFTVPFYLRRRRQALRRNGTAAEAP